MYSINGIVYAGNPSSETRIHEVKALDDLMMIVTFSNGEKRIFDASILLSMPAFKIIEDESIFKSATIDHGIVVWNDGEIDVAPEFIYLNSYVYNGFNMA